MKHPTTLERPLLFAHTVLKGFLEDGDVAVDATTGRGHDTVFLCQQVGGNGRVYGIDIQEDATRDTRAKLREHGYSARALLLTADHSDLAACIEARDHGKVRAVCFNLGYLPASDKSVTTRPSTTIAALNASLSVLADEAVITIVTYTGHEGGNIESDAVESWASNLDQNVFTVYRYSILNQVNRPPGLLIIEKHVG